MARLAGTISIVMIALVVLCVNAAAGDGRIVAEIRDYITDSLRQYDAFVEVEDVSIKSEVNPALDFDGVRIEAPYGVRPARRVPVTVVLVRDGVAVKRLWATVRVRVFKDVVVAARTLKIHEKVGPGDVRVERVELKDLSTGVVGSLDEVVGMMVRRPVRAGSYIKRNYLEPETLVRRGEAVTVVAESRTMRIRTVATALEDGYPGSFIEARTAGGKSLFGLVTENGDLLVRF